MASKNPEKITNVRMSQLSVARFYGGCTYNGDYYWYDPKEDTLTRDDIYKKLRRKSKRKPTQQEPSDHG